MMPLKTLVLGASPKSERYSFKAVKMLQQYHHSVIAVGARNERIGEIEIQTQCSDITDIDTVTMYLGPKNQVGFYDCILALKPRRIIFNPGTYNQELVDLAIKNSVQIVEACTLVLLSTGQYD